MKIPEKLFSARAAIVLLVMMLSTATTAWAWQGSGTSNDPYQIASYEHLLELHDNVNNGQKYENDYFLQTQDITWPSNTTWDHAIGYDYSHCFSGHYNGNGKKISGFRLATSDAYAGLFGFFNGSYQGSEQSSVIAEVHHLTLENPTVTVTADGSSKRSGALVGNAGDCSRIYDNYVYGGTVSFSGVSNRNTNDCYAGGVVGYYDNQNYARLYNINVVGTTVSGAAICGGLAGYLKFDGIPEGCFTDATVSSVEYYDSGHTFLREGAIAGYAHNPFNYSKTASGNYYHSTTLNAFGKYKKYDPSISADAIVTPNDPTGYTRVYTVTCSGGVTATATTAHTYNGTSYYEPGSTVTLSGATASEGYLVKYTFNGAAIEGNTFTITADATAGISKTPDPNHLSVSGTTYTIMTLTGWNVFCDLIEGGESFSGKTVKLNTDIGTAQAPVTRMAGSVDHEFRGIFDGDEHTLTVNISTTESNAAPFREIKGATISHLKVSGSVSGKKHSSGLVGYARGESASVENTIEDCLVETAVSTINSTDGDCYLGGIVGHGLHSKLTIRGCAFTGSLTSPHNYTGGLQGWSDGNTLIVQDDLFEPSSVNAAPNGFHPVAIHANNATTAATVSNVYYTVAPTCTASTRIAANGKRARSITAGAFVSISAIDFFGKRTYSVSGIAAYDDGGLKRGNNSYCGSGDNVQLTLSNTVPEGYTFSNYAVSPDGVSLSGPTDDRPTLTMPDADVTVSAAFYVNMPQTGKKTVNIPSGVQTFKVYDDGGPSGFYSYNCDGYLTLTAPEGYVLMLSGNIKTQIRHYLTVYDGGDTTAPTLLNKVCSDTSITPVNSTRQSMTLWFYSDTVFPTTGLDLTVTLVSTSTDFAINGLGATTGGSIAATVAGKDASMAKVNERVTLTATPTSGYLLSGISVVDENNNAVNVSWDGWCSNTASFTMPTSDVTVIPTFTNNNLTADGGLYVNMPQTGTKTVNIPSGVQSFKVYDDGGANGYYSNNCDGYLTLTAPEGYVLQLSGSITTESNNDYLTAYNGDGNNAPTLLHQVSGTTSITTVQSNGRNMTLWFYSDGNSNYAGLDLTVTVVSTENIITVNNPAAGGSIAAFVDGARANEAKWNDVVTLTATHESDYLLSGISVVDENNNAVNVSWDGLPSNTATFTMPLSKVTVTPTFTNNLTAGGGLYVNMPQTGTKTVTIPSGVKSFKVYDDGGANGYYSNNCNGYLTLTAPEGYALKLEGSITTEEYPYDYLTAYDGSGNTAPTLLNQVSSPNNGQKTTITSVNSTGRSMTLYFESSAISNYAGLDLTVTVVKIMELADGGDNSSIISAADGMYNVTLSGRPLYKDGAWNTLCLPFSLALAGSPLDGAEARTLQSATLTDGTLDLQFGDAVTELVAGTPYIIKWDYAGDLVIKSAADWNSFASAVAAGNSYEGKVVQLGSGISVSEMVGTENCPFMGTFDGAGHTLNVNIMNTNDQGTAPFRYISGATIMNVKVTGTVYGGKYCAGLVGFAWSGTNRIMNCEVAANVYCTGTHCGGILGHGKSSATTISNCLFSGSIYGATSAQGIIYGWGDDPGQHTIENCLAAGTYSGTSNVDLLKIDGGTQTINNCYRKTAGGTQGKDASSMRPADLANALNNGGADWQVDDGGNVVPVFGKYESSTITDPTFNGVTIDETMHDKAFAGAVTFKGTYDFQRFAAEDRSILLLGAENTLYWPQSGASIGAFRAYFVITAGDVSGARLFFGNDDTQGIISVESGKPNTGSGADDWFTLDGRRLGAKPAKPGIYVHGGRKVVVR